jgi:hypothetical protein
MFIKFNDERNNSQSNLFELALTINLESSVPWSIPIAKNPFPLLNPLPQSNFPSSKIQPTPICAGGSDFGASTNILSALSRTHARNVREVVRALKIDNFLKGRGVLNVCAYMCYRFRPHAHITERKAVAGARPPAINSASSQAPAGITLNN